MALLLETPPSTKGRTKDDSQVNKSEIKKEKEKNLISIQQNAHDRCQVTEALSKSTRLIKV